MESAPRFDEVSVARTARRHKADSESPKRFERGVDPADSGCRAAQRAVELLVEAGWCLGDRVLLMSFGYGRS